MMQRSDREEKKKREYTNNVGNATKWIASIVADPRQILAGFLTVTMFVMLAHMIRREHLTPHSEVKLSTDSTPKTQETRFEEVSKLAEPEQINDVSVGEIELWKDDAPKLKSCWTKPTSEGERSEGYVTFSLTDGPEYHVSQIADAVLVARRLGATLVLPDIRGGKLGDERNFEDVYDAQKFIKSLDGVVRVVKEPPSKIPAKNLAAVKVPNHVTKDYIRDHIKPVFRQKGNIRLATYFPSVSMKKSVDGSGMDSAACMAMFESLQLQPKIRNVVDLMVERLRTLSPKSDGRFIAVDLRVDLLEKKGCQEPSDSGSKSCYNAGEVAAFLKKIGFGKDTTIYLTQSRWDSSLTAMKELFPRTYTKEGIMPMDKKDEFLNAEAPTLEEVIDFYISSESDVFVPAISGLFYANVAGRRISSGKTQILVPADIPGSSASADNYISDYVTKKNHLAYSCFC